MLCIHYTHTHSDILHTRTRWGLFGYSIYSSTVSVVWTLRKFCLVYSSLVDVVFFYFYSFFHSILLYSCGCSALHCSMSLFHPKRCAQYATYNWLQTKIFRKKIWEVIFVCVVVVLCYCVVCCYKSIFHTTIHTRARFLLLLFCTLSFVLRHRRCRRRRRHRNRVLALEIVSFVTFTQNNNNMFCVCMCRVRLCLCEFAFKRKIAKRKQNSRIGRPHCVSTKEKSWAVLRIRKHRIIMQTLWVCVSVVCSGILSCRFAQAH